jgi:hypothetical protein
MGPLPTIERCARVLPPSLSLCLSLCLSLSLPPFLSPFLSLSLPLADPDSPGIVHHSIVQYRVVRYSTMVLVIDPHNSCVCVACNYRAGLQRVKNGLRSVITDPLITVSDTIDIMSSTDDASVGLNALFTFVAALCSILIFFAAWLSFDANIRCDAV